MVRRIGMFLFSPCDGAALMDTQRWSKISKAMGGRRTPRQVASRVQKYFEKLKLFGVNVGRTSHS